MKGIMLEVTPDVLEWRRTTGAEQFDEMWEGVLHMVPCPDTWHQDTEGTLETWLRIHWARPRGCRVYHQINVARTKNWRKDYRIPDLVFLKPDRSHIDRGTHFEGPPNVVVEIRSKDDETYEKFPFYARLGVPEVWVIEHGTSQPRMFALAEGEYQELESGRGGWVKSPETGVELRATRGLRLQARLDGDESTMEYVSGG